ncbi:MAG: L,D-transpeptidase [Anaerolineae bacterium]|nr:L,D-transpeptidase [Anaerolineae bacterium]
MKITRRDFLKMTAFGFGNLALIPGKSYVGLLDFPEADRLGRVCVGRTDLKIKPDYESASVGVLFEDEVLPWVKDVVGSWPWRNNQRWVETPSGYIWSPYLQPVANQPQEPINILPVSGETPGMWVEVNIPFVDAIIDNPPVRSAWWRYRQENGQNFRFYYSQILWVDKIRTDDTGQNWYRINERYGNPGDVFWCPAKAFRVISSEELAPISPDIENKRIEVDINYGVQSLSCYEGNSEVYYCRISSGKGENSTPFSAKASPGFPIWRKLFSLHMGGSTAAGSWDVPGVGWTSLFQGDGVAIHSTYWHNNYGEPMSHGCVNVSPEDAKWIFRWAQPEVSFETGDITIVGEGSTRVTVKAW